MVRIGFDPGLEAEQQHREQIKLSEYSRLLQDRSRKLHERSVNYLRILALLGNRLAMFGSALEERYGQHCEHMRAKSQTSLDDGMS
jgi:hypothetical protein